MIYEQWNTDNKKNGQEKKRIGPPGKAALTLSEQAVAQNVSGLYLALGRCAWWNIGQFCWIIRCYAHRHVALWGVSVRILLIRQGGHIHGARAPIGKWQGLRL